VKLAAAAAAMGVSVDLHRIFALGDPAYIILVRAIVAEADVVEDRIDKARATKIANAIVKSRAI
jgi:hypothetical protein